MLSRKERKNIPPPAEQKPRHLLPIHPSFLQHTDRARESGALVRFCIHSFSPSESQNMPKSDAHLLFTCILQVLGASWFCLTVTIPNALGLLLWRRGGLLFRLLWLLHHSSRNDNSYRGLLFHLLWLLHHSSSRKDSSYKDLLFHLLWLLHHSSSRNNRGLLFRLLWLLHHSSRSSSRYDSYRGLFWFLPLLFFSDH